MNFRLSDSRDNLIISNMEFTAKFGKRNLIIMVCVVLLLGLLSFTGGYFAGKSKAKTTIKNKYITVSDNSSNDNDNDYDNEYDKWRQDSDCPVYKSPSCSAKVRPGSGQTLVLVSLDGFRAEYLQHNMTPAIKRLIKCGVHPPYMRSVYPTKTFPNHYSIVTGLYPESHGIVGNTMYSPAMNKTFHLGSKQQYNPDWWGGEPIWMTAVKQGKKAAAYFWPGSDVKIKGMRPTYFKRFDLKIPFESRVDGVLSWLMLPPDSRPDIITLYFSQPDHFGHMYGPSSDKINEALAKVDLMIDRLMQGIHDRNLVGCVNTMIMADHGMSEVPESNVIDLRKYINYNSSDTFVVNSPAGQIRPLDNQEARIKDYMKKLTCANEHIRVYRKGETPVRFHNSNNERICPILLEMDEGYTLKSKYNLRGQHGYDNMDKSMRALFVASGPIFKQDTKVEPFQNIELYELMCTILGLNPAPNNGTSQSLFHLLKNKPNIPAATTPTYMTYSSQSTTTGNASGCTCKNSNKTKLMKRFMIYESNKTLQKEVLSLHDPFIILPAGNKMKQRLISHDLIILFDKSIKMASYSTFTLSNKGLQKNQKSCWQVDFRVGADSPKCSDYNNKYYKDNGIAVGSFFNETFASSNDSIADVWVTSNSVPVYQSYKDEIVLPLFNKFIKELQLKHGQINVVHGPIFDYGTKDAMNNQTIIRMKHKVPSHFFYVLTTCEDKNTALDKCKYESLNTFAYILPHQQKLDNCQKFEAWMHRNSARVRDVELLTGLRFYNKFPSDISAQIRVRLPTIEQWD